MVKERKIGIEVNPLSNQVLKLVDDLRNHPCAVLMSDDYPVVISRQVAAFVAAENILTEFPPTAMIRRSGARFHSHTTSTSPSSASHQHVKTWEPSRNWFWIRSSTVRSTSGSSWRRRASGRKSGALSLTNLWEIKSRRFSLGNKDIIEQSASSVQSCIRLHNTKDIESGWREKFLLLSFFLFLLLHNKKRNSGKFHIKMKLGGSPMMLREKLSFAFY